MRFRRMIITAIITTITRMITITMIMRTPIRSTARRATSMTNIAVIRMGRRRTSLPVRAAGNAPGGDLRRGTAPLLGRDPGAGLCLGARHLLGRNCRDLRDGHRHRDHRRGDRDAHGLGDGLAPASPRPASGYGSVALRGIEVAAAGVVLVFASRCSRLHGERAPSSRVNAPWHRPARGRRDRLARAA